MSSDALLTDLYELTMSAGYWQNRVEARATFELYCHTMPGPRAFLVACGLRQALDYIRGLRFTPDDIGYLKAQPAFHNVRGEFFETLSAFRFQGDVWALEEGEICFASEPILQVEASVMEAQILETYLLSVFNISTLVASKAGRVVHAAGQDGRERMVIDFGSRRAHGPQAGVLAARAAYIAGCAGTSNVFAGKAFGIPVFGTMAHSWVQAFDREEEAFEKYGHVFPDHTILLIDTYDTLEAARKVAAMKQNIRGVRLDSGDLLALSRKVRRIFDEAGRTDIRIFASGNLNEYKIERLVKAGAPIDAFGVGTEMVVSRDAPALDLTYKLVQLTDPDGTVKFKAKRSRGKQTVPGRKQVYRHFNRKGLMTRDVIALATEQSPAGFQPLLKQVIRGGDLAEPLPSTAEIRASVRDKRGALAPALLKSRGFPAYPVGFSREILRLKKLYK
ncbi:MAG: nicotinate phosphoribosyltransferase [Candidatus Omnitrophota bacterium]|nr:nicotinate phosphoribosyltransferase [Candidatus Omnitrophota bacterium]MDZ4242753.1 nicotinate phosphoribosyltransferase [Candidatus Omnitrophota bacterium]